MSLKLSNISKKYTDQVGYTINLLKDISLQVKEKSFTTILAPVGSGKSSLLRIMAELDNPTSGNIENKFKKRVFIPTMPSSFPWLSVEENISFKSKLSREEVSSIVELVGLKGYEDHYPNNQSEGFRFRISLGRAIAHNPDLILIDEPFNKLATSTRQEIYKLLHKISTKKLFTMLLGTTNITEAIFLSNQIYLMKKNPGEILDELQVSLPEDRNLEILESNDFISIRNRIENIFKERADRQLYNFSI